MNAQRQPDVSMPAGNIPDPINHTDELTVGREVAPAGYADAPTLVDDSALTTVSLPPALSIVRKPIPAGLLFTKNEAFQLLTDYGNARRLHFKYNHELIYTPDGAWYKWNGQRWCVSSETQLQPLVVSMINDIVSVEMPYYKHLVVHATPAQRETYWIDELDEKCVNFIVRSYAQSTQLAALKCSASLLLQDPEFDSHRFLLNVNNGTVDLKTGTLLPHDRNNFLTKLCPVKFDSGAQCPRWDEIMGHAFPNKHQRRYIQKMFGYAITGDVSEKKLFFLFNAAGNSGKSTWTNIIRGVLGHDFIENLSINSLAAGNVNKDIRSDIAKLVGKRFVVTSEPDQKFRFNESFIKVFTGGDPISARHPSGREKTFMPEFTAFVLSNFSPVFKRSDVALMRRIVLIPIEPVVSEDMLNPHLTQDLLDPLTGEKQGILSWLVEGARMWAEDGGLGANPFDFSSVFSSAPEISVEDFIRDCCSLELGVRTKTNDLLSAFNKYRLGLGDQTPYMSVIEFRRLLDEIPNIPHKRSGDAAYREGICILTAAATSDVIVDAEPADDVNATIFGVDHASDTAPGAADTVSE